MTVSVTHMHVYTTLADHYMYTIPQGVYLCPAADSRVLSQSLPSSSGGLSQTRGGSTRSLSSALLLPPRISPDIMAPGNLRRVGMPVCTCTYIVLFVYTHILQYIHVQGVLSTSGFPTESKRRGACKISVGKKVVKK